MKISCDVIMDLLPLYYDGVCNEASKKIIEEHLEDCSSCKHTLEEMKNNLVDKQLKQERNNVIGHHKKAAKRKSILLGISIAVACFTILLLVDEIYHGNEWFSVLTIPALYGSFVALVQVNRRFKANAFTRLGICIILGVLFLLVIETSYHWISEGVLRLRFSDANLFIWNNYVTMNANIDLLVLLTCCIVGGILLGIGLLQKKRD